MTATETNTLIMGVAGYEYQIGSPTRYQDVWTLASRFGITEENETRMYIDVVRTMFERYNFSHIQDAETFGDDEPRTFRKWIRAYRHRFQSELPMWQQLAIRRAHKV